MTRPDKIRYSRRRRSKESGSLSARTWEFQKTQMRTRRIVFFGPNKRPLCVSLLLLCLSIITPSTAIFESFIKMEKYKIIRSLTPTA